MQKEAGGQFLCEDVWLHSVECWRKVSKRESGGGGMFKVSMINYLASSTPPACLVCKLERIHQSALSCFDDVCFYDSLHGLHYK